MRNGILLAFCLALGGCVSYQGLPASWAEHEKHNRTDDCASIAGSYANRGEYPNGSPAYLTTLLIPERERGKGAFTTHKLEKADTVTLKRGKNAAFLMQIRGNGVDAEKRIDRRKGHYRCVEGVMHMDDTHSEKENLVIRSRLIMRYLYRADDWLYIKSAGMASTMLLVVPLNEYEYRWARFPVLRPETEAEPESGTETKPEEKPRGEQAD